ncbi:MAG: hypothetical protein IPO58_26990 [Betaproteobacteria bacterium]|nr:hypothetical protein [Betaproteobacteria bacterium]
MPTALNNTCDKAGAAAVVGADFTVVKGCGPSGGWPNVALPVKPTTRSSR